MLRIKAFLCAVLALALAAQPALAEGLHLEEKDGKYGIVDGSGTVLIPFAYAWNAPEITDFDYDQYAAGEFPFDRSAFTDNPADIVRKTSQGLVFSFHPLAAEEREPKKKYATCYRVRVFAKDGTELFSDRAFYEEYREDGV